MWRPHAAGLYNTEAPYWQGERAERIVRDRVRGYRTSGRSKLRLAFTGTRAGGTGTQVRKMKREINRLMDLYTADHIIFVHGACKGGDFQFHMAAIKSGAKYIEMWPSTSKTTRMLELKERTPKTVKLVTHRAKAPLDRNADIVKGAFRLIALPKEAKEVTRSGTWSTVRIARKSRIPVKVIKP